MQHAGTRTLLDHYLSRRVTIDTQAIVRELDPQNVLMRAACRNGRSIDLRLSQELTQEQSLLFNLSPCICNLVQAQEKLKYKPKRKATKIYVYQELCWYISDE